MFEQAVGFPSSAAVARIRGLAEQITKCRTELVDAERALTLASKSRDLIELNGGNPDDAVRKAKSGIDLAKRKLSGARSEFVSAFIAGREECEKARSEAWVRTYTEIIRPRAEKITAALQVFEQTVNEIGELLQPDSETLRRLETFDAATDKWNLLVDELGGPGNARLNTTAASKGFRASLAESANFSQFEHVIRKLKEVLSPPPAPRPPITEEQIAIERERAAETSLAASSRLQAESEKSRLREDAALQSTTASSSHGRHSAIE